MRLTRRAFTRSAAAAAMLLVMALAVPLPALAQSPPQASQISIRLPGTAQLGEQVVLEARLIDAAGAAIPDAQIDFVATSTFFLGATSDVVLTRARTNKEGLARAEYEPRSTGAQSIVAQFAGSERAAPAKASAELTVVADEPEQLYEEHAGVRIPGLNKAPVDGPLANLWPGMSGWPIAGALLIVWSTYAFVVLLIFRIAALGVTEEAPGEPERAREDAAVAPPPAWGTGLPNVSQQSQSAGVE